MRRISRVMAAVGIAAAVTAAMGATAQADTAADAVPPVPTESTGALADHNGEIIDLGQG